MQHYHPKNYIGCPSRVRLPEKVHVIISYASLYVLAQYLAKLLTTCKPNRAEQNMPPPPPKLKNIYISGAPVEGQVMRQQDNLLCFPMAASLCEDYFQVKYQG